MILSLSIGPRTLLNDCDHSATAMFLEVSNSIEINSCILLPSDMLGDVLHSLRCHHTTRRRRTHTVNAALALSSLFDRDVPPPRLPATPRALEDPTARVSRRRRAPRSPMHDTSLSLFFSPRWPHS